MTVDLEELEALCAKATPGPWRYDPRYGGVFGGDPDAEFDDWVCSDADDENAELIAASRSALPELLGLLEEARELLTELAKTPPWNAYVVWRETGDADAADRLDVDSALRKRARAFLASSDQERETP